jgi:hypothetical protein
MIDMNEVLALVQKVFEQERDKNRADWRLMRASLLNNRLLSMTERKFQPQRYGAKDFRHLIGKLYPWVQATRSDDDYIVEWRGEEVSKPGYKAPPGTLLKGWGVREDLWASMIDYRSGKSYVWDPSINKAREGRASEGLPLLPTLTSGEVTQWRADFLERHKAGLQGADLASALRWKEQGLSAINLPKSLQQKWNRDITRRVRRRLRDFFGERADTGSPTVESPELVDEAIETVFLDEDAVREARDRGHPFAAGQILAEAISKADDELLPDLIARVVAYWATPLQPAEEPSSLEDLVQRLEEFSKPNIATALVNALQRVKQHQRKIPEGIGDLAFRIKDDLYRIYGIEGRSRPVEACQSAVARIEAAMSAVSTAVDSFLKCTPSTAKAASLEILKATHQLQPLLVPAERSLLRELEIVLGTAFRKFCESYERHEDAEVVRRAPELRQSLQRFSVITDDPRESSGIWLAFVSPVLLHVSSIVEEATSQGEVSLSPVLALVNPNTKADLQIVGSQIRLSFRLANTGRGQAINVMMGMADERSDAKLALIEPRVPFSIGPEGDQMVVLGLTISAPANKVDISVRWFCNTASGTARRFDDKVAIDQQSTQPEWDRLLADPPYTLNPIKRRERLYGRDSTLQQLRLAALSGASTFLWGQKRIGKTSLLQVLANELAERVDTSCLLLRMGEITSLHEGQLAHRIAERLVEVAETGSSLAIPKEEQLGAGMGRLVPFVEKLVALKKGHKFVVVIDEFDDLDSAFYTGERGRQFIKALRSLSEIGLTFFFVGSERMDMIYRRHQSDLNKWRDLALDRIDNRNDCKALITEPVADAIEYSQQAVDFIIDYCGGNPFYIHNFCYQVFDRCVQEHRTFVGENDLQVVRQHLLQSLGQTNFAHFWEDNPELDASEKVRQTAENCIALTCLAVLGGQYTNVEELVAVQETLQISADHRASLATLRRACDRLKARRILLALPREEGFAIALPIFREWLADNADPRVLNIWSNFVAAQDAASPQPQTSAPPPILDVASFPIAEEELIAISQKLVYCGRQKDAAEIRQWLRQFDDENRIEIAFLLLKRLTDRGFINEGNRGLSLHKLSEMVQAYRLEVGKRAWNVVRGRFDNLCITYVDSEHKSGASTARELQKLMRAGKCASAAEVGTWMKSHLADDPIVIVADDFAGTGKTVSDGLKDFQKSVDPKVWSKYVSDGRIAVYVMFSFPDALKRISRTCAGIKALAANVLGDDLRALDQEAGIFESDAERRFAMDMLTQIGRELTPQAPLGFGDMGALVAFHNAAPNNTLPIFWSNGEVNEKSWRPLFPRA